MTAETGSTPAARMAALLQRVQGESSGWLAQLPEEDRERLSRFLDPGVEVPLDGPVGAAPWIQTDPSLGRIFQSLVWSVLSFRDYSVLDQFELLRFIRLRAEAFRRQTPVSVGESLKALFALSPMPVMLCDRGGQVVFSNAAFNRISGFNVQEAMQGRGLSELASQYGRPFQELLERVRRGEVAGVARVPFRSFFTGRELVVTMQSFPIFDDSGVLLYTCVLISDETERSHLERRLDHSQRVLVGILDAIGDPVVTCDRWWNVQSWNRAAAEVLKVVEADRGRSLVSVMERRGGEELEAALEELVEGEVLIALGGPGRERVPYGIRSWEGSEGGGEPQRVVVFRDMRLEVEREHHLRAAKEELEQVNRELRHLNDAKIEFMNIVSHELRSPLVTIRGYVEMILRGALGGVTAEQRHGLEVAMRNAVALSDQIETLLDFSRLEQGRMKFVLAPVRVCDQVRRAAEGIRSLASHKGVELELRFGVEEHAQVMADGEKLRRAVRLLLDNALKFTEAGQVGLDVLGEGSEGVLVVIWDTGVGIDEDHLDRIFDTFYQVKAADGGRGRGTGLGLSVARALIEGHGSQIEVWSAPMRGSRFSFRLRQVGG